MQPPPQEQSHRNFQVKSRLQLAATRLDDAQRARVSSIVAANRAGLSIRQIAECTGLSSSRVHQLLQDNDQADVPDWLDDLLARQSVVEDENGPSAVHLPTEVAVLRLCVQWLEDLEHEECVIADLRRPGEPERRVDLDRPTVIRALTRIASDLDVLAGTPEPGADGTAMDESDVRTWIRTRWREIDAPRRRRAEERAMRKAASAAHRAWT